jgi:hypothetical protein
MQISNCLIPAGLDVANLDAAAFKPIDYVAFPAAA